MAQDADPGTVRGGQGVSSFCFRCRDQRPGWNVILPVPGGGRVDTAALVQQAPEFLTDISDSGARYRVTLPASGGSASTKVFVAVDDSGGLGLVACPADSLRATFTSIGRELVELAVRLWRLSYEEFTRSYCATLGRPLSQVTAEKADPGWSEEKFRTGIGQSLEKGRFPVFVLVPVPEREAADLLAYLRRLSFEAKLVGVETYESWGIELIVPKVLIEAQATEAQARSVPRPVPPPLKPGTQRPHLRPEPAPGTTPQSPATTVFGAGLPADVVSTAGVAGEEAQKPAAQPPSPPRTETKSEPSPQQAKLARPGVWRGAAAGVMSGKRPPPKRPENKPGEKGR